MIKAVVFDVGGVLCDWQTILREFAGEINLDQNEFIKEFLKYSFDPKIGSDLGYMTMDEFFTKLTTALGVPEKAKDWRRRFTPGFKRIGPTFKLLDELKGKYKLALLTNAKIGLWDEWQEGKLKDYFEVIVDSSVEHVLKPDERIYQILLERLNLAAEECLFIDDTKEYVEAAEKLGFKTVHFKEPEESVNEIRKVLGQSIKAVVFDAGGVITEWKKPLKKFLKQLGVSAEDWMKAIKPDEESANKGLVEPDEYCQRIMRRLGYSNQWRLLRKVMPGSFQRIEQTFQLLAELKGKYRLAMLTNAFKGSVDALDKKTHHKQYFDLIIDSSVVGLVKPDKRIFLLTCKRLGLRPEDCLFVDDDEINIMAAEKLGFKTVHFTDPEKGVKLIRKMFL